MAQFEGDGHLQEFTRTKDGTKGKRDSSSHEAQGTVGIAGGKVQGGTETAVEMQEGYARVFDPLWSNARAFLDYLSENQLMQQDLSQASIGQFVIASGFLSIQDLAMFKEAWKAPSIQRQVKAGAGLGQKRANMTAAQKAMAQQQQNNTDMFLDMIQIMPHSVHARLLTQSNDSTKLVWSTLNPESLVAPASDLTLTYGDTMAGEWSLVGILSAYPEYMTPDFDQQFNADDFGMTESIIGQISKILAPIVRVTLGRPAAAYAITPLLIFREVS
ncbi:hypothetical protein [Blastomonas sp.]|uniref:hypothetical protein n=1 Tax=Blastomonas sp. TaxID=1909299 RepID=UPI00391BF718